MYRIFNIGSRDVINQVSYVYTGICLYAIRLI